MIFDLLSISLYGTYKKQIGPFIIIFYNPLDNENKELFFKLRRVSEEYKDVPVFRFKYDLFIERHPSQIESHNDILIIEKDKNNRLEKCFDQENIEKIFQCVRHQRLEYKKATNKDYKNNKRLKMRRYKPFCFQYRCKFPNIIFKDNDESEYPFPNSTVVFENREYMEKKINYDREKKLKRKREFIFHELYPTKKNSTLLKNKHEKEGFCVKCKLKIPKSNNYNKIQICMNCNAESNINFSLILNKKNLLSKNEESNNQKYENKLKVKNIDNFIFKTTNQYFQPEQIINISNLNTKLQHINDKISKKSSNSFHSTYKLSTALDNSKSLNQFIIPKSLPGCGILTYPFSKEYISSLLNSKRKCDYRYNSGEK